MRTPAPLGELASIDYNGSLKEHSDRMILETVTTFASLAAAGALWYARRCRCRSAAEVEHARRDARADALRFAAVVDHLLTGAAVENESGRILRLNGRIFELFGTTGNPDAFVGMDSSKALLTAPQVFRDVDAFTRRAAEVVAKREPVLGESIDVAGGRLIERDYVPFFDGDRYIGHLWQFRDVTRVRETERQLKESEHLFSDVAEAVPVLIWMSDEKGAITFFNRAWEAFTGQPVEQGLGDGWQSRIHPDDLPAAVNAYRQGIAGRQRFETAYRTANAAGQWRHILNRGSPRFAADGRFAGLVGGAIDITDRAVSERRFRTLFELSGDAHFLCDENFHILDCNPAAVNLTGAGHKTRLLSTDLMRLLPDVQPNGRRSDELAQGILHAARGHGPQRFEWTTLRFDGKPLLADAFCTHLQLGEISHFLMVWHDLTERLQAERWLREAKEAADRQRQIADRERQAAERASNFKSQFLANMSHEIRTPMTAIVGYADLLLRPRQSADDYARWSKSIRQNAEYLLALVNDILDVSKIEAGQITLQVEPSDPIAILTEVDSLFRPQAIEKLLEFKTTFDGRLPQSVKTDPVRFKQVLVNLVNNAIKFTDRGGVEIRVGVERPGGPDASPRLTFTVVDTGVGIPTDKMHRLFAPFSQIDSGLVRRRGGTGLGLAIARQFARLLGGDLSVESEAGKGSTFKFWIDLGAGGDEPSVDPAAARAPMARDSSGGAIDLGAIRTLVVDDNPDNRRIIRFLLEESNAVVTTADHGTAAIEAVDRAAMGEAPYDLILMDIQMPVMDGLTATSILRSRGILTPIIALTAYAMSDDRDRCLSAGCDAYVTKPIIPEQFFSAILHLLPGKTRRIRRAKTDVAVGAAAAAIAGAAVAGAAVAEAVAAGAAGEPSGAPMSEDAIISEFATDPDFAPLLKDYIAGFPAVIADLDAARTAGDREQLKVFVHRLKGTGASYGYPTITTAAAAAEKSLLGVQAPDEFPDRLDRLIDILRAAVRGYESNNGQGGSDKE